MSGAIVDLVVLAFLGFVVLPLAIELPARFFGHSSQLSIEEPSHLAEIIKALCRD